MEIVFFGAGPDNCPICIKMNGKFTLMELHLAPHFCVFTLSPLLVNTDIYRGRMGVVEGNMADMQ
jgi:hypothetical protein